MNIAEILIGVAGLVGGAKALKKGLDDAEDEKQHDKFQQVMTSTPYKTTMYQVSTIQQRIARCIDMTNKGRNNAAVREFATRAVAKKCGGKWCVAEKDYLGEVEAVYGAVRNNVRYVRDTFNADLFQSPMRTMQFRSGDCDDFSILIAALLQSIGYPVRFRVIRTRGSSDWNHIYNMVGLPPRAPRKWVPVDGSVGYGVGWQAPARMVAAHKDFEVK